MYKNSNDTKAKFSVTNHTILAKNGWQLNRLQRIAQLLLHG